MLPHDVAAAFDPPAREAAARREAAGALRTPARERAADALVALIAERHEACARRAPYVATLLAKVAGCDGRRNAKLGVLCDVGQELADVLEAHAGDVERELFPALLSGTAASDRHAAGFERAGRRHGALALHLARLRWLADDFAVPPWGGRSYQALMEELEALEGDVLELVQLEALVFFPGAGRAC